MHHKGFRDHGNLSEKRAAHSVLAQLPGQTLLTSFLRLNSSYVASLECRVFAFTSSPKLFMWTSGSAAIFHPQGQVTEKVYPENEERKKKKKKSFLGLFLDKYVMVFLRLLYWGLHITDWHLPHGTYAQMKLKAAISQGDDPIPSPSLADHSLHVADVVHPPPETQVRMALLSHLSTHPEGRDSLCLGVRHVCSVSTLQGPCSLGELCIHTIPEWAEWLLLLYMLH